MDCNLWHRSIHYSTVFAPPPQLPKGPLITCFCSSPKLSHMEATIFETSPKVALGFCPLIAAWVSLKNRAYADTGFCGSLGSFFFFFFGVLGFLPESGAALFSPVV